MLTAIATILYTSSILLKGAEYSEKSRIITSLPFGVAAT